MQIGIEVPDIEMTNRVSEDVDKVEERWSEKNEAFLKRIKQECLDLSSQHNTVSHKNKKRYVLTAVPSMLLPLVLANTSVMLPGVPYLEPIGLTCVAAINVFQTILNFGKKSEVHNTFSGKYALLASYIDKTLVRKKAFRSSFDVILERVTMMKTNLDDSAPYL